MKVFFSTGLLFVVMAFTGAVPRAIAGGNPLCPRVSHADLLKMQTPGRPLTVKFFASWCGSCKDDLEGLRGQAPRDDLILLSAFDDEASAAATLQHFDVRQLCRGGDEVARRLGVHHLPRSFRLENGKFEELHLAGASSKVQPDRKGKS